MDCYKCPIYAKTIKKCNPKGTENNPGIYFIGEAMGPDENKVGIPFVGRAGKWLHQCIEMFGLNENNCRFNNCIRCYPDNGGGGFRPPEADEIENCKGYLLEDIIRTDPKVIVALGTTASRTIIGDEFSRITQDRGKVFEVDISGKTYKVIPTYHPSYLIRNHKEALDAEFRQDIKLAMRTSVGINDPGELKPKLKDNVSTTIEIYDYNDFDRFCMKFLDNVDTVSYDIETNAQDTHSADHRVVGFSLAPNKDIGCYIILDSIDFTMDPMERKKIEDRLSQILLSKQVIVYNCLHELPATLNWLGIEIPNIVDVLIMVKLMMGTADNYEGNGGLKAQSVMHLHSKDWSRDLDEYAKILYKYKDEESHINMKSLLSKYYEGEDLEDIMRKVEYIAREVIPTASTFSYAYIPSKLISRYGSIDSSILFELKEFYEEWMERTGKELGIDLKQGYKYWMWHHYAGYVLERNGAYWNDEKASKIEKWCSDGMNEALRNMIISPLVRNYLKESVRDRFMSYLFNEYTDNLIDSRLFSIKRKYARSIGVVPNNEEAKRKLSEMSIAPNKQGVYKLEIGNIKTIAKDFIDNTGDIFEAWFQNYLETEVLPPEKTHDDLKGIFNPNTTNEGFRNYVSNMLITDTIRVAKLYDNIVKFTDDPGFSLEEYIDNNITKDPEGCNLISLVYKLKISERTPSERLDIFTNFLESGYKLNNCSWKIKRLFTTATNYKFENMDADTFNHIYELYLMCHIDVEDRSTWNPQFEWMFNYKMYKKFSKLRSTYINGKVGRKSVYEVDRESYSRGDEFTKRERPYSSTRQIPPDKMYMSQTSFRVNMADTGRWTAGIHNLPASDAIKGIFTSRFKGGCIAMPDGSQMEVRTLAAESGDEALLQAFKDGIDIHRFFASRIYNVPYEDVQKWQRGLAKNAVFGILYGESEQAFADTYLNGDLGRAREIFEGMFSGFPKIKNYIDRKHNQYETQKKVTTLTQRFINLANSRDDPNRLLRQSQNYPIQASAEDIAGVILYKLCEWLKENNMKSKPFCFIHDSIEIDMHPDELFLIVDKLDYLFNKFPLEEFNVPVACDIPISTNMGAEIEVKSINAKDDYNDITITLCGFEDDIEELIDTWKTAYKIVEKDESYEPEEPDKPVYMPIAERFLPKKAPISMKQGSYRNNVERRFHVIVK